MFQFFFCFFVYSLILSFGGLGLYLGSYDKRYLTLVMTVCATVNRDRPRFFDQVGIKRPMHLLEISIFSLNNVIIRLIKIMNRADKNFRKLSTL